MMRTKLVNLYINPDHYNEQYNYYNYHKFKTSGVITILYKTPSIFLNGLYFEFPHCQILNIEKAYGTTNFILTLNVNNKFTNVKHYENTGMKIIRILESIDTFNTKFFKFCSIL